MYRREGRYYYTPLPGAQPPFLFYFMYQTVTVFCRDDVTTFLVEIFCISFYIHRHSKQDGIGLFALLVRLSARECHTQFGIEREREKDTLGTRRRRRQRRRVLLWSWRMVLTLTVKTKKTNQIQGGAVLYLYAPSQMYEEQKCFLHHPRCRYKSAGGQDIQSPSFLSLRLQHVPKTLSIST